MGFPGGASCIEPACKRHKRVSSLGWEDPLEEGMATHSSILAWRTPRTEEPGGLQSMRSQRVGHNLSNTAHMHACASETPDAWEDISEQNGQKPCPHWAFI